jgi:hypothetical protein
MPDDSIDVGSMVSHRDKKGYVELRWGDKHAQLPLEDARGLAENLMAAASAAETDAFLFAFYRDMGADDQTLGAVITQFRRYREGLPFERNPDYEP